MALVATGVSLLMPATLVSPAAAVAQSVPAAQVMPAPFLPAAPPALPLPVAPGVPVGPLGSALAGAYGAVARAQASDPAAASRAAFAYAEARQRAQRGDFAGALAAANAAQAAAAVRTPILLEPARPDPALAQPDASHAQPGVGRVLLLPAAGVEPLPPEIVAARDEIARANRSRPGARAALEPAKRRYRAALDAYLSGDAAGVRREARAAFDSAADVLSRRK